MFKPLSRFLVVWLFSLVLLAGILGWGYWHENKTQLVLLKSNEQHAVFTANQFITSELGMLKRDALYLSGQNLLKYFLEDPNQLTIQALQSEYKLFLQNNPQYFQLRYIDIEGNEIVRVNNDAGNIQVVNAAQLQNKSQRYYIQEGLRLEKGQLHLSQFDLNVESGEIERPFRPVIRIVAAVFNDQNIKTGLVVLNYEAQVLIDQLNSIELASYKNPIWLVNSDGYWLVGPNDKTWGFQLTERKNQTLNVQYPVLWKALKGTTDLVQVETSSFIFSGQAISFSNLGFQGHPYEWYLISYASQSQLDQQKNQRIKNLLVIFFFLALLSGIAVAAINHWRVLHHKSKLRAEETEKRFQYLLSSAPDAIIITDENGRITLCNSQTVELFEYTYGELVGLPVEMLMPLAFREKHQQHRQEYAKQPTARLMMSGRELVALSKSGSEIPVEISLSPLQTSEGLFITVIIRNITERKQAEYKRLALEKRFREIVDNVPVGVFRKNTEGDGRFIEINQAMVDMFEASSSQDLIDKSVSNIHSFVSDVEKIRALLNESGHFTNREYLMKTVNGRQFYAEISAAMRLDEAGNKVIDGVIEDISLRKQRETEIAALNQSLSARSLELETINHELEAFSYSVSHDLRAPLRAIDGFSRTLFNEYKDKIDERGLDRLNRVRNAAQRMATLIDDLLRLSRVSRTEINKIPTDLSGIALEVAEDLRQAYPERNPEVSVEPFIKVNADPQLMRVVFENLMGNAFKFTAKREDAKIEVGHYSSDEGMVCFVRDNGAGFDMKYADKLFGAFQRLHDDKEFQGTGIGLATVQRVIHKHSGRVWAESAPEHGATFYFLLR